ncbi:hypothetical protein PHYPSEUDO_012182 [Phytophthora pseudosyringae]|uniref:Kinesin motor domain-containing protein n=1 Tax=Phytophthora pseudosyringae TaxID=221518 RepID=A0A8T1W578_9STRA|nr:hypothetical protein PHYPSEUDO_012182 [Phytophthora pseudosyringae]
MSKQARAFMGDMSETSEVEAASDEEESAGDMESSSHDGLAGLFCSPAPSTAGSMTETIDSREEVRYCDEWELFSDATFDKHDSSDNTSSDEGGDQAALSCVNSEPHQSAIDTGIDCARVLVRSQQVDTDKQDSLVHNDDAERVLRSAPCSPASSTTTDNGGNFVPSRVVSQDRTRTSRCEASADTGVHRRIQVVVRVRPPSDSEGKVVVTAGEKEGSSLCVQATTLQGSISTVTECTFDRVFLGSATQEDVFAGIEPSVQACLEGYNATVFAYGQTGTGKTHTLFGRDLGSSRDSNTAQGENDSFRMVKSSWGIVPRSLSYLLCQASLLKQKDCQVDLHLSFLQIYNDRLFDLLTDRMRQKPLLIREQPTLEGTTSVTVQGLSSERITSFSSAMQIIHQGHTNRCVRETESNLSSSRSHAIVQIQVMTQCPAPNGDGQVLRRARLNLVDLAGSEKWNTNVEMEDAHSQELKNINASLSALGNCIAALTEAGRKHIPYRDSTLTRVLQDSFGGNTQSCLIATVNATQQSCEETIRTLHFADRARSVIQTTRVNEVADGSTELLMAKIQIVKLRERLESEQRRRHETRLKEHQEMQRDFQEKLKGKDKEITKLARDNAVFQRWRDEDVKKIRALESRIKDLEEQMGSGDSRSTEPSMNTASSAVAPRSKRQSASPPSFSVAKKHTPVQKTRSRANLTRAGSESNTAAARTYKQVIERYALGSSKGQQVIAVQSSEIAFDRARQSDASNDATNQLEDPAEIEDSNSPMSQKHRWEALNDNRVGRLPDIDRPEVALYEASGLCVSPVGCQSVDKAISVAPASSTTNSYAYSGHAALKVSTEWASSMLSSKSTPTIVIQKQETHDRRADPWSPSPANGLSTPFPRQEPVSLLKSTSTGSFSYNPPVRPSVGTSSISAVEPCPKHKLVGCMLCSVSDNFRPLPLDNLVATCSASQTAAARQPPKELATCSPVVSKASEATRKPQDGPCERHQLLRCFICMKSSSTATTIAVPSAALPSSFTYSTPVSSWTGTNLSSYQNSETPSKCALHALANCILCAGVKAMTRKAVVVPTPQASPDTRSATNHGEERAADRYRRYTLDERILNCQTQANRW